MVQSVRTIKLDRARNEWPTPTSPRHSRALPKSCPQTHRAADLARPINHFPATDNQSTAKRERQGRAWRIVLCCVVLCWGTACRARRMEQNKRPTKTQGKQLESIVESVFFLTKEEKSFVWILHAPSAKSIAFFCSVLLVVVNGAAHHPKTNYERLNG